MFGLNASWSTLRPNLRVEAVPIAPDNPEWGGGFEKNPLPRRMKPCPFQPKNTH